MTLSVVACDKESGQLGVAVATRFFAAGALVPFVAGKIGGIATQALVNPYYGIDGLRLVREGHSPHEAMEILKHSDDGEAHRQVQIVDACGRFAVHTGQDCLPYAGHAAGNGVAVAGNMLASQRVVDDALEAYRNSDLPFPRRLIAAMIAGEAAGGDRRGRQSAALIIAGEHEWPILDLRVDDHPNPLDELDRLERISHREWIPYRQFVPTRNNRAGITDHDVIDAAVGPSMGEV